MVRLVHIVALAILFLSPTFYANAQLSKAFIALLPDNCKPRPINKTQLTVPEKIKILHKVTLLLPEQILRTYDSIVTGLKKDKDTVTDFKLKIDIENILTYYFDVTERFEEGLLYSNETIKMLKGLKEYQSLTHITEAYKGISLARLGRYEESSQSLYDALKSAKSENDSNSVGTIFWALSYPDFYLELHEAALEKIDSSFAYLGKTKATRQGFEDIFKVLFSIEYLGYLNMYENTNDIRFASKMDTVVKLAASNEIKDPILLTFPAVKAYSQAKYARTILIADSILAEVNKHHFVQNYYKMLILKKYKGLSLYKTGKTIEGVRLMRECILDIQNNNKKRQTIRGYELYNLDRISLLLYQYYTGKKQWEKAYYYLFLNKATQGKMDVLRNRGKVLEVMQKYNFTKKEMEVRDLSNINLNRKKERNLAIATTAILALVLFIVVLLFIIRQRRLAQEKRLVELEAERKVDRLRMSSQIQIAELEDGYLSEQASEQKKLGMDLHDGLASQLAYIKRTVDNYILDNDNPTATKHFNKINDLITDAYNSTRQKSHELTGFVEVRSEPSFEERISTVLKNALPHDLYELEIKVDNKFLTSVKLSVQIEIIYILQEAMTNILKHANAKKITVVLAAEDKKLMMRIKDDGKGINEQLIKGKVGLGLQNIKDRSLKLNGRAEIITDNKGTEINVSIPVFSNN